jgi:hypothetical protein
MSNVTTRARCRRCGYDNECLLRQGNYWCHSCLPKLIDWPARAMLRTSHDYNFVGSKRSYGVELEVGEAPKMYNICDHTCFGSKPDGSSGVFRELCSPVLQGNDGFNEIDKLCVFAMRNKWKVNSGCGYHIHIDLSNLTGGVMTKIAQIMLGYYLTEDYWFLMVSKKRRENNFCHSLKPKYRIEELLKKYLHPNLENLFRNTDRYAWASPVAWWKHKTIEIRLHSATIHPVKVKNWLRAHLRFVDWLVDQTPESIADQFVGPWLTDNHLDIHAKMVDIWRDPELGLYYQERAAKFGSKSLVNWNPSFVEAM